MEPELEFVIPDIFYDIASELVRACPAKQLDFLEQHDVDVAEQFINIFTKSILDCVKLNSSLAVETLDCKKVSLDLLNVLDIVDKKFEQTVTGILIKRKIELSHGIDTSLDYALVQRFVEDRETISEPGYME